MPAGRGGLPPTDVYEIDVTLRDTRPPVWRRLLVQGHMSLGRLHAVLQISMGWQESHLHRFQVGDTAYSDPEFGLDEDEEVEDEFQCPVAKAFKDGKGRIEYEYDFGDSWEHELRLVKVFPPKEAPQFGPVCIDGARAGPPEDIGGTPGYEDLIEAMADPKHPRHDELAEWVSEMTEGPFNPERFDMEAINRDLKRLH